MVFFKVLSSTALKQKRGEEHTVTPVNGNFIYATGRRKKKEEETGSRADFTDFEVGVSPLCFNFDYNTIR